jgi:hypothetical protein
VIWHCFLDTNSLWASEEIRARVAALASASSTLLYVPDLVREERVERMIEEAQSKYRKRLPDERREKIRREVEAAVLSLNATVFSCRIENSELAASVALSLIRRRTDLAFRDGVVLLSSLNFAIEHDVQACVFVTKDTDLVALATELTRPYGVRVLCVDDLEQLALVLTSGVKKAHAFASCVEGGLGPVLTGVEDLKAQAIDQLVSSAREEYPEGVERAELEAGEWTVRAPLQALPLHPPVEGQECMGEVKLSMDLNAPGYLHMTVIFRGSVSVGYEDGRFTGEPRVRDLRVASVSV